MTGPEGFEPPEELRHADVALKVWRDDGRVIVAVDDAEQERYLMRTEVLAEDEQAIQRALHAAGSQLASVVLGREGRPPFEGVT